MRGSLHYAAHDETVSRFGRDDASFALVENCKGNGTSRSLRDDNKKSKGESNGKSYGKDVRLW
jgi:hypothetical protein